MYAVRFLPRQWLIHGEVTTRHFGVRRKKATLQSKGERNQVRSTAHSLLLLEFIATYPDGRHVGRRTRQGSCAQRTGTSAVHAYRNTFRTNTLRRDGTQKPTGELAIPAVQTLAEFNTGPPSKKGNRRGITSRLLAVDAVMKATREGGGRTSLPR